MSASPKRVGLLRVAVMSCAVVLCLANTDRVAAEASVPACRTNLARQLRALDVPALAAAIVKRGRVICASAAGVANIEQEQPATPDTLFLIASVSKTITGTALMQLRDQGKFGLDDDVNRYLPFRVSIPAAPAASITFRQLLTHTASVADNTKYINCPGSCAYGSAISDFVTRGVDSPISLADLTRGYLTPRGPYYDAVANFKPGAPGTISDYPTWGSCWRAIWSK
jgi:CubicO group peptidase (beta-lactamase class C family)